MLKIHNKSYYATKLVSFTVTEHVRERPTAGVNQRPSKNMKTTNDPLEARKNNRRNPNHFLRGKRMCYGD